MSETNEKKSKKALTMQAHQQSLLKELIQSSSDPSTELLGPEGLLRQLTKALVERAMNAELSHELGYERGDRPPDVVTNRRNGSSEKTVRTNQGPLSIEVPRDREGLYEPKIIPKHHRHFAGFDDKIISMYARGMSVRDIQAHLKEIYATDVSPELISRVTDGVVETLRTWQNRPLERCYLIVYLDALVVKIRDKGHVQNRAVYLAVGVGPDGKKQVLGMWLMATEGAKFWMNILKELRHRGVEDILVLCADGLSGLNAAVEATFPETIFQTCVVHLIRNSVKLVPWKERKAVCADLRMIYTATDEEEASEALSLFESTWGDRFPMVADTWRRHWAEVTPFLAFPQEMRRTLYTTNAIEALIRILRKTLKTRAALPSDGAAMKLIFLAIQNAEKTWGKPHHSWSQARLQFAIHFGDRYPH